MVKQDLKRESLVANKISSPFDWSQTATAGSTSDEESEKRCLRRKRHNQKEWRHLDSSKKLRDMCKMHRSWLSLSSQADSSLKIPNFNSPGLSSRSRPRSSKSDRRNRRTQSEKEKLKVIHLVSHCCKNQSTTIPTAWQTRGQNTIDRFPRTSSSWQSAWWRR